LSRNLVNVQDNIVKIDNDIEITTRKNVQEVPFILSSRDSEEIGLPFLASIEKKEMISSTSESYEFLPTRSTQNNTKSVIVTEDELSKGNNVTIDSDMTTVETITDEAITVEIPVHQNISEDIEVFNVTKFIATTTVSDDGKNEEVTTNAPTSIGEPIPKIDDPSVAEKLNRLMRKPLRKHELNEELKENNEKEKTYNDTKKLSTKNKFLKKSDKKKDRLTKLNIKKDRNRKPVAPASSEQKQNETEISIAADTKQPVSGRRRIPFHRRNQFSDVRRKRPHNTPRKTSLNLIKRMRTRPHKANKSEGTHREGEDFVTEDANEKVSAKKPISRKKPYSGGRRRLNFRKKQSEISEGKNDQIKKRREGLRTSSYRRRKPQHEESTTTTTSTTTEKVTSSTTTTSTTSTTSAKSTTVVSSTTTEEVSDTDVITVNPDAHQINYMADPTEVPRSKNSSILSNEEEGVTGPLALPQKQLLPIPSDIFSQATHHLMRTKNIRMKNTESNTMSKLINRSRSRFPKRARKLPLRLAKPRDVDDVNVKDISEDTEENKNYNIDNSNLKRGRYILAATTLG